MQFFAFNVYKNVVKKVSEHSLFQKSIESDSSKK